jgi:hypothetical protein
MFFVNRCEPTFLYDYDSTDNVEMQAQPSPFMDISDAGRMMPMKKSNAEKRTERPTTRTGRMKREKTINMRRLKREHQPLPPEVTQWLDALKPKTREECRGTMRPCPHVSCKFHLYLDVNPETGSIKFNFPGQEVHELNETCALDVAERGGVTLEEVGDYMNLTRERIRQVEATGIRKVMLKIEELNLTEELVP